MAMITAAARRSFEQVFQRAVARELRIAPGHAVTATLLSAANWDPSPRREVQLLTLSSFRFKLISLFQLADDDATREYFQFPGVDEPYAKVFCELANMCCGAMSRELMPHFPHLGLSTPYGLGAPCLRFLDQLAPEHVTTLAIDIEGRARVQAGLFQCGYAPVDFTFDTSFAEQATGELEML